MKTISKIHSRILRTAIITLLLIATLILSACDEFTDVDPPTAELNTHEVFEQKNSANAAMTNIYAKIRDLGLLSGKVSGMAITLGLYTDELTWYGSDSSEYARFYQNAVRPSTPTVDVWWRNAYSVIYAANAVIEGVESSSNLEEADKKQLLGEARFVRAIMHFYLMQVYGEIPYSTTTDYTVNKSVTKQSLAENYASSIADLNLAIELLPKDYFTPGRVRPSADVAKAFLAKVHLSRGDWAEAADYASAVILKTEVYIWEENLNAVFLKGSTAAIWQFAPKNDTRNTDEGTALIFNAAPPAYVALSASLMQAFEPGDQRKEVWTRARTNGEQTWYHAYKYKKTGSSTPQLEISMVMRLSEMYLIRAEARANQGFLTGAQEDLNKIRTRAALANTTANSKEELLQAILKERRVEFFTEQGHRFRDLKRAGKMDQDLLNVKPGWNTDDKLLPLPQSEIQLNPKLLPQNSGY